MLNIKILGSGCANCRKLEAVARDAAQQLQVQADFEKVTDMGKIMAYDILATPALVINEKVVSSGKIPTIAQVQDWIAAAQ
ncbi:thioredoxin family protein [Pseudomonas sp. N040]|uniref:thioredoxin family protein n=1 Tax=Pseudomonas sp. N040 TaxID=2785325 RepID=UPI0018A29AA6|nr:thioredoxin family protein [Pseudomonas sp. N040]MBF7731371.1 thioredoxin family protein [Pseudomonas sp. N040]MBW7015014.1 thioredoxin family protein [Pseudomonas sp. N040]